MPFNKIDGFIPRSFDEIKDDYKSLSQNQFPKEDFEDYEGGDLFFVHYSDMQQTLLLENTLIEIEEKFYTFLQDTQNQISQSKVGTKNGLLEALDPYVKESKVTAKTVEPGIIEIIGIFITDDNNILPEKAIAETIFTSLADGIYTKNDLGQTNTASPEPSDDFNKIVSVQDLTGHVQNIYFKLAKEIPTKVNIIYQPSDSNLQVNNSSDTIAKSFLEGMAKKDVFGIPLYTLGKDFEPFKYLNLSENPFAKSFYFEWSKDNGDSWVNSDSTDSEPYQNGEILTFQQTDISVRVAE